MGELDIATAIAQHPPWVLTHTSITRGYSDTTQRMWLHHLRHLTLTNQQRSSRTTAHAKRPMGLAHTRSSSVRQSVGYQAVSGDVGVGMGQVTQTTHHIGLGNPMWGRESDPGPRGFSRGSGPGGIGPVAGPFWCRLRHGWLLVSVSDRKASVCVHFSVF